MYIRVGKFSVLVGIILYIISLYIAYIYLISPSYSYYRLVNLHPPLRVCIVSSILAFLPATWSDYRTTRPSQVIYWILYIFAYIPVMLIPDFVRETPFDRFFIFKLVFLLCLVILYLGGRLRLIQMREWSLSQNLVQVGIVFFTMLLYAIMIQTFGFRIDVVSFKEVYDIREVYRGEANRFSGYAVVWLSKIMDLFLVTVGILNRNIVLIGAGIVGQIYVYSVTGHKSVALSLCLLAVVLFCLRHQGARFGIRFVWMILFLVLFSMVFDTLSGNITLTEIFTRRMLFLPGALSSFFFDFFSTHPKTHLGHSIFRGLVDYPYEANPSYVIGFSYFGSEQMSANVNMWADGYSAFGYVGMILFTILLTVILWIYDSISANRNFIISVALMVMPAWSLVDSSFIIALMTNGIFIAIGLNYLFHTSEEIQGREKLEYKKNHLDSV
ncbi:hypothetical protein [Paenilisteria rocourtiae]|uniref:Oligosaccharide repeat unit polymerase n=1 Tax=Listeria rocourtiae TaxID=647910 RepID=A0A4R6ZPP4_9LIST|nr:hypothetical protein [Listeria rocourtiae]EUJ45777.1 putative B-band O-antigen polymerase [Listeria rocourtiae FSL F6-920]MBC1434771.1 hypothetical protein [Listeria rocourtiae]TDR54543.1 hypothetical protein DFP96_102129 [Listeria rocourtiae]